MQVVHTKTQEEYNELLDILNKKGGKWCNGNIINRDGIFKHWYQEKTCVNIDDITSLYVWLDDYFRDEWYQILSLNDYKKMNDIPVCEFKRWEIVEIRDNLRHEWSRKIFLAEIFWSEYPFICADIEDEKDNKEFMHTSWKFCRKIDTAKKRLVMMTDEEYNLFIKK